MSQLWRRTRHGRIRNQAGYLLEVVCPTEYSCTLRHNKLLTLRLDQEIHVTPIFACERTARNWFVSTRTYSWLMFGSLPYLYHCVQPLTTAQVWKIENSMLFSQHAFDETTHLGLVLEIAGDATQQPQPGQSLKLGKVDRAKSDLQQFRLHRDLPGSGTVVTRIVTHGRTRVLIFRDRTDIRHDYPSEQDWQHSTASTGTARTQATALPSSVVTLGYRLRLHLPTGFVISLVDHTPQELILLSSRGISVTWFLEGAHQELRIEIDHYQVSDAVNLPSKESTVSYLMLSCRFV